MHETTKTVTSNATAPTHRFHRFSEADFTPLVNAAFKNYHSVLTLARSPLANSTLVTPLLVLDDVSPTNDERGHALRLVLQWAVNRLAPASIQYPLEGVRPLDDPTWRDPYWWRYNILRHRYLEPLHPDEFVEGGRSTETLIALTGIPSTDTFFDERNRAVREVAQRLRRQLIDGDATDELQQLALAEIARSLQTQEKARALLGIAATFDEVFPRALLLHMAAREQLAQTEEALDYLTAHRFLLMGDGALNLWLSPVLQRYVYARQPSAKQRMRHQQVANYYRTELEPLKAAKHLQQAQLWREAATLLFDAADDLVNELQIEELCAALLVFKANYLPSDQWREVQILLSDLFSKSGRQADAMAACRHALKVTDEVTHQARIYRRIGKLYENHNQLHALGYYQQAVERFKPDNPELLDLLKDRAWLYIFRQEWSKAEADLTLALAQTPENAREQRANIYDAFASLYRRQKRYDEAVHYAQDALGLREETGNLLRVANSFHNLGLIYNDMGEYHHAVAAYQEAMTTYQQLSNRSLIAAALLNIGMAYHLDNHLPEATQAYRESLAICQEIGLPLVEVKAHSNLAEALTELGQIEAARQHWQTGYALSCQADFEDQIMYFKELQKKLPALQTSEGADKEPNETTNRKTDAPSTPEERAVLEIVKQAGRVTPKLLMETIHISKATATRRLGELVERGYLEKQGEGRGTYYTLAEQKRQNVSPPPERRPASKIDLEQMQRQLYQQEQHLRQHYNVTALGLLRQTPGEMLTLAVRFAILPDLLRFFELEKELEARLGIRIDLRLADLFKFTTEPADITPEFWLWL